ncbi:MAG: hypothetical protein ABIT01_13300 [Thermoanaerobaculia bacterium]
MKALKKPTASKVPTSTPRPMGRPPKEITPELLAEILEAIKLGVPASSAAIAAGVSRTVFHEWLAKGRAERDAHGSKSEFADFADAIEKARAEFVRTNVRLVQKAGETSWQAAMTLLERRDPENFGRRETIAGDKDKPLRIDIKFSKKWRDLSPTGADNPTSSETDDGESSPADG